MLARRELTSYTKAKSHLAVVRGTHTWAKTLPAVDATYARVIGLATSTDDVISPG